MPTAVCSSCGKGYRVPDQAAGKKFKCKNCGGVIAVPGLAGAAVEPLAAPSATPMISVAKPKKAAVPPPLPVARIAEVSDGGNADLDALASLETGGVVDDSIPFTAASTEVSTTRVTRATVNRKSAPMPVESRQRFAFGFNPSPLSIGLVVVGLILCLLGGREALLASGASQTPQDITCADLGTNGPGNNAHVRVTDFKSMSHFIGRKSVSGDWQTVWLPIIPPSIIKAPKGKHLTHTNSRMVATEIVDSSQIHVLIKSHSAHTPADVDQAMKRDSVEGLVVNKIEKLTDNERQLLQHSFPAMDVDSVCIVEDGRKPAGGLGMLGLVGGGVVMLCGLFILFKPVS